MASLGLPGFEPSQEPRPEAHQTRARCLDNSAAHTDLLRPQTKTFLAKLGSSPDLKLSTGSRKLDRHGADLGTLPTPPRQRQLGKQHPRTRPSSGKPHPRAACISTLASQIRTDALQRMLPAAGLRPARGYNQGMRELDPEPTQSSAPMGQTTGVRAFQCCSCYGHNVRSSPRATGSWRDRGVKVFPCCS